MSLWLLSHTKVLRNRHVIFKTRTQNLLECEQFALGSTAVTIIWIYSPLINRSERTLVQNFFFQLTEKLSWKNEMYLDTDYAQNHVHLSFVLEFNEKLLNNTNVFH